LSLSLEDDTAIEEKFKPRRLKKRQYLLQEIDVCKYAAFIVEVAARVFSVF
jgi:hypothetical protein